MKKIIIIGANNLQLPLIIKAKEMNLETHVFAWEDGAVGKKYADYFYPISITEKEKILEYAKEINPDGVVSIASDLATITVNYLSQVLGLTGNNIESSLLTTDKSNMRNKLSFAGLPCPQFNVITESNKIFNSKYNYPIIVKPVDRSGSRGVTRINSEENLADGVKRAMSQSFSKKVIIEEYINGKEISVEMISWKGEHTFLQMTDKITTGYPYYVEKEHHQPSELNSEIQGEIVKVVKNALTSLGIMYGASHSEVMVTKDNHIYIIEVGGRMGGDFIGSHLVFLSTGYDFLKNVINISLNVRPEKFNPECYYSGVYYQIPESGRINKITDETYKYTQIVHKEIYLREGDAINTVKESNDRASCYIYRDNKKFITSDELISFQIERRSKN